MNPHIEAIPFFEDNYAWLLTAGVEAALIDPGNADSVLDAVARHDVELSHILLTHHHPDHIDGALRVAKLTGAKIVAPQGDDRFPHVDITVCDGDTLTIGNCTLAVFMTPGHTGTSCCYYCPRDAFIFTGDTLLGAGCGRVFDSTHALLQASLQKIATLPVSTSIYCGHEYTSDNLKFVIAVDPTNTAVRERFAKVAVETRTVPFTLAEELATNPFLRCNDPAIRAALRLENGTDLEVFTQLRTMKNVF